MGRRCSRSEPGSSKNISGGAVPADGFQSRQRHLQRKFGDPMKIRIPTKLGFENPKHVISP
jgi:hypothetical protein